MHFWPCTSNLNSSSRRAMRTVGMPFPPAYPTSRNTLGLRAREVGNEQLRRLDLPFETRKHMPSECCLVNSLAQQACGPNRGRDPVMEQIFEVVGKWHCHEGMAAGG